MCSHLCHHLQKGITTVCDRRCASISMSVARHIGKSWMMGNARLEITGLNVPGECKGWTDHARLQMKFGSGSQRTSCFI